MSTKPAPTAVADWKVPSKTTGLVLVTCWAAILAEGYDVGVMGAILPALKEYEPWGLDPVALGALSSTALVGMLVGALFIGTLSDLYGRKRMLLASMVIFTLTQIGVALAPTPEIFGLFRFLGGLGMGGIIPVAAALTIEYSAPHRRSRNYGLMYSGYSLGIVVAALVALIVLPMGGWRWVVAVGAVPILVLPLIAWLLPESLEFLVAKRRFERANALAKRLGIRDYAAEDVIVEAGVEQASWRAVLRSMFSRRFLQPTTFFWISLFCGMVLVYGLNTWLPTIMRGAGYDLGSALTFLLVFSLASAIGGIALGMIADRFGQKPVLVTFYLLGGAGILLLMFPNSMFINLALVAFAGIGSISTSLVLTGYIADYYPPNSRATATGWALSFARIGAIMGPIIGGWIAAAGVAFQWNFIIFAIIAAVAAGAVALIPRKAPAAVAPVGAIDERVSAPAVD